MRYCIIKAHYPSTMRLELPASLLSLQHISAGTTSQFTKPPTHFSPSWPFSRKQKYETFYYTIMYTWYTHRHKTQDKNMEPKIKNSIKVFRFLWWLLTRCWTSCVFPHCVVVKCPGVSEEYTASIFRVTELVQWRMKWHGGRRCVGDIGWFERIRPTTATECKQKGHESSQPMGILLLVHAFCSCNWPNSFKLSYINDTLSCSVLLHHWFETIQSPWR
jgi:hypothetical protein